jgi:hypothetical protein
MVIALLLIIALVVAAILFVLQRAFPAQMHNYQSYELAVTPSSPWHAGQSLSLQWEPSAAGMGPGEPPSSITCTFSLYGPYGTQAVAQTANNSDPGGPPLDPSGPPTDSYVPAAASAPPLTLSTAVGAPAPAPVAFALPDTLQPGYYVVVANADLGGSGGGGGGSSGSWVVEVTA